jgi:hypothetical protein
VAVLVAVCRISAGILPGNDTVPPVIYGLSQGPMSSAEKSQRIKKGEYPGNLSHSICDAQGSREN